MKQGTQFEITLIADERFLGSCKNVETIISVFRSSLKTAVSSEGIEIYSFGEEKLLDNWQGTEKEKQIRQKVTLILSQKKTKDDIYKVINQVQSQPIKFLR
jgi:hypothetical protein